MRVLDFNRGFVPDVIGIFYSVFIFFLFYQSEAFSQSISPVLGQGYSASNLTSRICLAGDVFDFISQHTIDQMTSQNDGEISQSCSEKICKYSSKNVKRPFQIVKSFALEHRVGKRILSNVRWSTESLGKLYKTHKALVEETCGDRFVNAIEIGGRLNVRVVASFTSAHEREIFLQETQFDLTSMRNIRAHLSRLTSVDGELQIYMQQTGGDVADLGGLISSSDHHLLCRLSEPFSCLSTLDKVLDYSLKAWISSLKSAWTKRDWVRLDVLRFTTSEYATFTESP